MKKHRVKQSRAQRRALATVFLLQRMYLRARGVERLEIDECMRVVALAAHEIDAFTVWYFTT